MSNPPERIASNFETDLQNIIYDFIRDNFGQTTLDSASAAGGGNTPSPSSSDQQRSNRSSDEYRESYISTLRNVMRGVNTNIQTHEENMREYIQTVHSFLSIMQSITPTGQPQSSPTHSYSRPYVPPRTRPFTYNTPLSPRAHPLPRTLQQNLSYLLFPTADVSGSYPYQHLFQNVVVCPTSVEIDHATEVCEYNVSMDVSNLRCPITLETFQPGDLIRRIRFCGHAFKCNALDTWFNDNVRCPLCRYDIRTYQSRRNSRLFPSVGTELDTESYQGENEVETNEVETNEVESRSSYAVETNEVETDEVETNEVETNEVETNEVETNEVETNEVESRSSYAVETNEVETDEVETNEVETNEVETNEVETNEVETRSSYADEYVQRIINISANREQSDSVLLSTEINQFFRTLTNGITTGLNSFSSGSADASNDQVYRLSIPIEFEEEYDLSDNLISRTIVGIHK
jgi:hypothetical protein